MQFTKLRLTGFKSFVEPTEFLIEPGLTGIVGPNGCGKSNLVEALQWVMGETSARRLRGGEMDDVIFGGTTTRPARNIATVTLSLDNRDRTAPAHLNDHDELEIERRIDRDRGSTYRVNSREQRARDVQLLFADAASGAQSAALIGQGRIGWLINAKPAERRTLLEEAAGIGGLQARRHEAELRLSATETNLTRLEDVAVTLSQQIDRLKRQVKQAERYRTLSDGYRQTEALVLLRHLLAKTQALDEAIARLHAAETVVEQAVLAADTAMAERIRCAEAVAPARLAVDEANRRLDRLSLDLQAVTAEERAISQQIRDLRQRIAQIDQDIGRETALITQATAAKARLDEERDRLEQQGVGDLEAQERAAMLSREAGEAARAAEAELNLSSARVAQLQAERSAVQRRVAGIEERRSRLRRQQADAELRTRELDLLGISTERLEAAAQAVIDAEALVENFRGVAERAEQDIRSAQAQESAARPVLRAAEQRCLSLNAEIQALSRLVQSGGRDGVAPVLDGITVEPGYETALGAVLGDDLLASLDPAAPIFWAALGAHEIAALAWPAGVRSLAEVVTAPAAMTRRLQAVGLIDDPADGWRLQSELRHGQRLVARDGGVWRWDGLTTAPGAPTAAAIRLAQRNRLLDLERERKVADAELETAQAAQQTALKALETAQAADRSARDALRSATQQVATARANQAGLLQQANAADARRVAAQETLRRLAADQAEIDVQAAEAQHEIATLPDPEAQRGEMERLRQDAANARERERGYRIEAERLLRDAAARQSRLAAVAAELGSWQDRMSGAQQQHDTLNARRAQLLADLATLEARPQELQATKSAIEAEVDIARGIAREAALALSQAEAVVIAAERRQIEASERQGDAREARVRAESGRERAVEARRAVVLKIAESFDCGPEALALIVGEDREPASLSELETRLERLRRDREAIGPVNLMAESELEELAAELETNRTESADLRAAIARLRQGIQELNRESRGRLLAAFETVNRNFKDLFVKLFGGGAAHLELINHENDPLQAGLEIMASPPGKKLQMLSLLSGGERALTALALVFAMFLTNPAPICVLDEVDAPLDDANVERFCHLVRDIGSRTGTRFLIVTHHRVSMAKMDRLYGVTMIEKGISRLVSVDLGQTDALRRVG